MKIDVVMLTKNSVAQFENPTFFNRVLDSVLREINLNRFIVVDGYSTDNTLEVVKKYTPHIVQKKGGRGGGREIGIKNVETEWFAFVDSDVILCPNWQKEIEKSIHSGVGAIHGLVIPDEHWMPFYKTMALLRRQDLYSYLMRYHKITGMCMDILIRSELVKDIKIPRDLHVREDQFIRNWIEKKGYKYVVSKSARCLNAPRIRRYIQKGWHDGIISRRYGYITEKRLLWRFLSSLPKGIVTYLLTRHWLSARNHIEWNLYWTLGYYHEKFRR